MKKTAIIVLLALAALLVVAGCSTQAQSSNKQYYVPSAGGCGVAGPAVVNSNVNVPVAQVSVNADLPF